MTEGTALREAEYPERRRKYHSIGFDAKTGEGVLTHWAVIACSLRLLGCCGFDISCRVLSGKGFGQDDTSAGEGNWINLQRWGS